MSRQAALIYFITMAGTRAGCQFLLFKQVAYKTNQGKIHRLRGFLRIDLGFGNNIADKGKTLEPPVSLGTKVTPHSPGHQKAPTTLLFSSLFYVIVSALNTETNTYICLVDPISICNNNINNNNKGLSYWGCLCVLKKLKSCASSKWIK